MKKNNESKIVSNYNFKNILCLIIILAMCAYMLFLLIQNLTVCDNIRTGELKEYIGGFDLNVEKRTRNTIYFVVLSNGDTLKINPDLMESHKEFKESSTLHFVYSSSKFATSYTCVEIKSIEKDMLFLDKTVSYSEAKGMVHIELFILIIGLLLSITFLAIILKSKIKGFRKKKK